MSLDELAKKLNVTRKTIYNWQVKGKIPQKHLVKMSELFGCTIDYLLVKEGDP